MNQKLRKLMKQEMDDKKMTKKQRKEFKKSSIDFFETFEKNQTRIKLEKKLLEKTKEDW